MTKIVSIHSYRGGTGKSNTTANLATTMALMGKRVGIVDTDIQSPGINILFGLKDKAIQRTLNDYLWGRCAIQDAAYDVSDVINGQGSGGSLYLLPSSMKSEDIAKVLSEGYDVELLQTGLYDISEALNLDYLFIDTHPGINEETLLCIGISNTLILILRPDQQDFLGTAVVLEVAENLDVPQMLLIVNKVLPDVDPVSLSQKVQSVYNKPVVGLLPLATDMMRLGSQGIFCLKYPDHPIAQEYKQIVTHIG
jgi:MinD-like ATPase involved in chromosome partitioning or flagellar assembly